MLEKHEIDAFLAVAEELHFGRAAQRLHVSTARVSQTIAKLERRIAVPLFNRTTRKVELTALGRQLYEEIRPAWDGITAAFERAVAAGRGMRGTLRVAFVGAAGGQLLAGVTERFRAHQPDCEVQLREAQIIDLMPWLRDGTVDLVLGPLPFEAPGVSASPALMTEARLLAVPAGHPFARRTSISLEELTRTPMLQLPDALPASVRRNHTPDRTPSGRPIPPGPRAATFNEVLTLIGTGQGVFTVGTQATRYYTRPDVAYVPLTDAPPLRWGLLWRTENTTARVRAFTETAQAVVDGTG